MVTVCHVFPVQGETLSLSVLSFLSRVRHGMSVFSFLSRVRDMVSVLSVLCRVRHGHCLSCLDFFVQGERHDLSFLSRMGERHGHCLTRLSCPG